MATITQHTCFELALRELVTLADARGHVLACESGELWITIDGDGRDIILGPGQSHRIGTAAPVVVSAVRPATLSVHRQEDFGPRARKRLAIA